MRRISMHQVALQVLNRNNLTVFVMSYTPKAYVSKKRDRVRIEHYVTHSQSDHGAVGYIRKKDRKMEEPEVYKPDIQITSKDIPLCSKTVNPKDIEVDEELVHFSKQL